jgi:hypothetical protein
LLEIVCLNCTLDGVTLCPEMRKPFDALVEGRFLKESGEGGIRTPSKTPANSALPEVRAAKCAALATTDPELLQVVQSWPDLPEPIKLAILALVRSRFA